MDGVVKHKSLGEVKINKVQVSFLPHVNSREITIIFHLIHANSYIYVKKIFSEEFLAGSNLDKTYELIAESFDVPGYGDILKKVLVDSGVNNDHYHHVHVSIASSNTVQTKTGQIIKSSNIGPVSVKVGNDDLSYHNVEQYLQQLPGIFEIALHPITKQKELIKDIIINLNDQQGWSREKIADWLDTLDVDLRFKTPDATVVMPVKKSPQPVKSKTQVQLDALEKNIETLVDELAILQSSLANATKTFLALKEAIDNEQD